MIISLESGNKTTVIDLGETTEEEDKRVTKAVIEHAGVYLAAIRSLDGYLSDRTNDALPIINDQQVTARPAIAIAPAPGCDALVRFGTGFRVVRLQACDGEGFWMCSDGYLHHTDSIYPLHPIGMARTL